MISAKVYEPTVDQRKQALKVADRFPLRRWLITIGLPPTVLLVYGWFKAEFTFPLEIDALDLGVAAVVAVGVEIYRYITKTDQADLHASFQADDVKAHGPLQYRLTSTGLDWWQGGQHEHLDWPVFSRFGITRDLVILAYGRSGYWVFPRAEIGEPLVAEIQAKLAACGSRQIAL